MPTRYKRACLEAGCLGYAERFGRCEAHAAPIIARRNAVDRSAEAGRGLYFTTRWKKMRAAVLRAEPLCRDCAAKGRPEPATEIDHVVRHQGNAWRFWDMSNLQPLCARCHARKTFIERREARTS